MDLSDERTSAKVEIVSQQMLDRLSVQATQSPRLRKNHNFHASDADPCHRLLNAMEPDSYIQPHRHLSIAKDESLVVLRGKLGLIIFADDGAIKGKVILQPAGNAMMANIPHGTFHTLVPLGGPSVFFEAKAGPFIPVTREEKAPWAPQEGAASAAEYLASLKDLF